MSLWTKNQIYATLGIQFRLRQGVDDSEEAVTSRSEESGAQPRVQEVVVTTLVQVLAAAQEDLPSHTSQI